MVDVEKGACSNYSDISCVRNRNVCIQLDLDGVQSQRYCLGLVKSIAYSDCACFCVNMVHGRGRTTAYMAGSVEMGAFSNCSNLSGIIHWKLRLQLDLDRIYRSR